MRLLVTGGCGFLGVHFIERLLAQFPEAQVKVIDLRCPEDLPYSVQASGRVVIRTGRDICRLHSIENDFKDIDVVVHLAGLVSFALKDKARLYEVNTSGSANVAKLAKAAGVRKFVHISSVAALGYGDTHTPVNEDFDFDWSIARKYNKHYSLSKHFADAEIASILGEENVITLYPGLMLGPGDFTNSPKLINSLALGKVPKNMPGGTNVVDARDVAQGICDVLKKGISSGRFLLAGDNLTYEQINTQICKAVNVSAPAKTMSLSMEKPLYYLLLLAEKIMPNIPVTADNVHSAFKLRYFDNTKAVSELGWKRQYDFARTITDTVKWMEENGMLEG
ncbi:MAG: NAD-dependent epimerase/dehydratase family protein [Phycisphaerae bacterium]|jgi:nucleoside-diphosphate-sugar epimerase